MTTCKYSTALNDVHMTGSTCTHARTCMHAHTHEYTHTYLQWQAMWQYWRTSNCVHDRCNSSDDR